jgi:hypothetical protein
MAIKTYRNCATRTAPSDSTSRVSEQFLSKESPQRTRNRMTEPCSGPVEITGESNNSMEQFLCLRLLFALATISH